MDGKIDGGGGGGGVLSGVSSNGSISTLSKEDNLVLLSSEVSSSSTTATTTSGGTNYELELGLGLSLGCGGGAPVAQTHLGQHARILTAEDFPCVVSKAASSSSSVTKVNHASCGTKRNVESFSPPGSGVRSAQVVGWPPVRTYRMNSLGNQGKSPMSDDCNSTIAKNNTKSSELEKKTDGRNNNDLEKDPKRTQMEKDPKRSLFVKVNMDGIPIGRKVDVNAHTCYKTLAQTLDDMFYGSSTTINSRQEQGGVIEPTGSLQLLDGSSGFVLTYEDKDGDWMLVGDVPWEMFISSVKRLKIMTTSDANGLAPVSQPRNERGRTKHV